MGAQPADAEHALACRIPGGPGRSGAVGPGGPSSSPRVGARCFLGRARPATIPAYSAGDAAGLADGRRTALRSRPSLRSGTGRPHNPPAPAPRTPAPVGFAAAVVESLGPPAESEQLVTRLPRIPACSAGDPNPLVHRHSGFPSALALGTSSRGGLSPPRARSSRFAGDARPLLWLPPQAKQVAPAEYGCHALHLACGPLFFCPLGRAGPERALGSRPRGRGALRACTALARAGAREPGAPR